MIQKPKIQYVGQFYVYGSEARALEQQTQQKKPKTRLPLAKLETVQKVYVDPVALAAIAVAIVLLCTMILGVQQLRQDWAEYRVHADYVHSLRESNHEKTEAFRQTYDLADIRAKASAMGMVPKSEVEHMVVDVTIPEPEPEMTALEHLLWFVKGLFA